MTRDSQALDGVEARNLTCERGGRIVFRNLDFEIARGHLLALEGPNGAGKTSALRMLAGLLAPAAGTIGFHTGERVITDGEERGRLVGWIGHLDGIKAQLTVIENVRVYAGLYRAKRGVRAKHGARGERGESAALERVGLARLADLPSQYLSAGQRRRLALARLIVSARPLWLLDEPLAALDAAGKRLTAELITGHCAGGGIVIAATHEALNVEGARPSLGLEMGSA